MSLFPSAMYRFGRHEDRQLGMPSVGNLEEVLEQAARAAEVTADPALDIIDVAAEAASFHDDRQHVSVS
ncbi:hypothetical protein I316_07715 [Kwoniella heveanensis BCC8398]|uniref:Uncharacterized protein n=1 Tax=Kwoniella heveanensis BCC8398 TaxID=1296120 RepID=A0A1B9GI64_9TREE|nr:hypothetical protein I316_07715 [Kwoniella heveanensis BCC8398]